jgi:hypothetical protein
MPIPGSKPHDMTVTLTKQVLLPECGFTVTIEMEYLSWTGIGLALRKH